MADILVRLPKLHKTQREAVRLSRRFTVGCCGRQWGKNYLGYHNIVNGLLGDTKGDIKPAPMAWFAPTYKNLLEDWRYFRDMLAPITTHFLNNEHRIEVMTGVVLEMWSLDNPDASRGRKYGGVVMNECAMVPDIASTFDKVIRATLFVYSGWCRFYSTPRGLNSFYDLWKRADGGDPEWSRFRYRTEDNSTLPAHEIIAARRGMPERVVRQELDAEFLEDGAFFQNVEGAAVIDQPDDPANHAKHYKTAGIDWALSEDYTVITIFCRDCNRVIAWDRFNQIEYIYQRERVMNKIKEFGVYQVLPERNSIGQPNIEMLRQAGINVATGPDGNYGFGTTATTKPALIQQLASCLAANGTKVPRDYADELRSYYVETMASGSPRFSAPAGYHDDRVISLALAVWAATRITHAAVEFV